MAPPRSRRTVTGLSSELKASQARPSAPDRIGLRRCNATRSKDIGLSGAVEWRMVMPRWLIVPR